MTKPTHDFKVEKKEDAVIVSRSFKRHGAQKTDAQNPLWVLLWSDRHWDNPHSPHDRMIAQLEQAKERNAIIVDTGDFFCAMQGKYDPRSNKSSLREEHKTGDYIDALVETGTKFLSPYRDRFAFMSPGNHELSIRDRRETDMTERVVSNLRRGGSQCVKHRYSGYTRFKFTDNKFTKSILMWHTHGYGGGGPVTKDVIQASRQGNFLDGVDVVVSGHTHDAWIFPVAIRRLNRKNKIESLERLHIKVPSNKDMWGCDSWEDLKGMPPKPVGAMWLKFWYNTKHEVMQCDAERVRTEFD
tara:strand:+ start:114 stop:1010 length:897 start_codon:yes stop_codon:yes gene_type:complete